MARSQPACSLFTADMSRASSSKALPSTAPQKARDDSNGNRTAIEALCVTQRRSLRATTGLLQSTDPESVYLETRSLPISELAKLRSAYLAQKIQEDAAHVVRVRPPPASTQHTEKAPVRRFDGFGSEDGDDNI
eukprot:PhM_4_TR13914/c1_g4_i3/m.39986